MAASHLTDDAVLEQKIAAVVLETLQKEADALFAEKIAAFVRENERRARELSLMERMVRVEEELKALREVQVPSSPPQRSALRPWTNASPWCSGPWAWALP